MPVTSDSYESKVSAAAVALIAGSATFQAITAAANATAAKAFIVEDWSGVDDARPNAQPKASDGTTLVITNGWAVVRLESSATEHRAFNTYGRSGTIDCGIMIPTTAADNPAERFRRARNAQGLIRAEMQAQLGATDTFASADIRTEPVVLMDETGALRDHFLCPIIIDWRDLP